MTFIEICRDESPDTGVINTFEIRAIKRHRETFNKVSPTVNNPAEFSHVQTNVIAVD